MDVYRDLSSASIDVRHQATAALLDKLGSAELEPGYVLKRLCRGLCSSAACARQGFASALTALLLHTDAISDIEIAGALKQHLFLPDQASRQDKKDLLIGYCFALLVLCRSNRLRSVSASEIAEHVKFIVTKTPDWAFELVQQTIIGVVQQCKEEVVLQPVREFAENAPLLDSLAMSFRLPGEISPKQNAPSVVLEALRLTLPHIHCSLQYWLSSMSMDQIRLLWRDDIEAFCFCEESTVKHKLLGLVVIESLLDSKDRNDSLSDLIETVFSHKSLNVISASVSFSKHSLHITTIRLLKKLVCLVRRHPKLALTLVRRFGVTFDLKSRSKTVVDFLQILPAADVDALLQQFDESHFKNAMIAKEERIRAMDLVLSIVRKPKATTDFKGVADQIFAFFVKKAFCGEQDMAETCRARIISSLACLMHTGPDSVFHVMSQWHELSQRGIGSFPIWSDALNKAWRRLDKAIKKSQNQNNIVTSFRLLISALALFSWINPIESEPLLTDAIECFSKYNTSLLPNKKLDDNFGNVLLDIVIAMCSQSCLFLREVALSVFRSCSQFVGADALLSLVGQLSPKDNVEGAEESEDDELENDDSVASDSEFSEAALNGAEHGEDGCGSDKEGDSQALEETADYSDEEQYEAALVNYIKLRQQSKKDKVALKIEKAHFRIRLVDILEQFARANGASVILVDMVVPCLRAIKANEAESNSRPLAHKISTFLSKRIFNSVIPICEQKSRELLASCIHQALHSGSSAKLVCFRLAVNFASRVYLANHKHSVPEDSIVELYTPLMESWLHKKSGSVNTQFLQFIFERNASIAVSLSATVAVHAVTASNEFLRTEAYTLLSFVLRKHCKEETLPTTISKHQQSFQQCLLLSLCCESDKARRLRPALDFACILLRFSKQHSLQLVNEEISKSLVSLPQRHSQQFQRCRSTLEQFLTAEALTKFDSNPKTPRPKKLA